VVNHLRRALLVALLLLVPPTAQADGLRLTPIGKFNQPTFVLTPPGQPDRVLVVEKGGRIAEADGSTYLTVPNVQTTADQGLLSAAFSPDGQRLYVFYDDATACTDTWCDVRVDEFHAGVQRHVLQIEHRQAAHQGGQLQFGPDGLLYVSTGDGASSHTEPSPYSQDSDDLRGKILRLDPTSSDPPEVWARGLRNPWRFSFDGSRLIVGDVGEGSWEEVDVQTAPGANFGWPACEGPVTYPAGEPCSGYDGPVLAYPHTEGRCAVTGGYVLPDGRYVYGDYCDGQLRTSYLTGDDGQPLGLQVPSLSSFGRDGLGRLYAASLDGPVYRLDEIPSATAPPTIESPPAETSEPSSLPVSGRRAPTVILGLSVARRRGRAVVHYTLSRQARVRVTLAGRVRYARVLAAVSRGRRVLTLRRLVRGRYRVTLRATADTGTSIRSKRFTWR
jgi:hypothetical protein